MVSKNNSKKTGGKVERTLANAFDFPKEVMMDIPKVTLIGNNQLIIENHKGIAEYTAEKIRIGITGGEMIIYGKSLMISSILVGEITIHGEIDQLSYDK